MNQSITLAGGCFWGTEKFLSLIPGIVSTQTGYANGKTQNITTYEDVCGGNTGHSEAVKVEYDPSIISLPYLLRVFYHSIDPTLLNRQGNDRGTQYRTGVYYEDLRDKAVVENSLKELESLIGKKIWVECLPLKNYCPAEETHQKYLDKKPGGYCHIGPREFEIAKRAKDSSLS